MNINAAGALFRGFNAGETAGSIAEHGIIEARQVLADDPMLSATLYYKISATN